MKRFLFIHNPAANRYRSTRDFNRVVELAQKEIKHVEFLVSKQKGDISKTVKERIREFDVVVACGGDGTIREIAVALLELDVSVGIIPMGSGNDLAKSLCIPSDLKKAITLLKEETPVSVDIGYCNDIPFLNTLGFGFDGLTNKYASKSVLSSGTLR